MTETPGRETTFDLLVVGGGVNGCGIARDAAGRGFSTMLCEMDDLASGTSSRSTKLIHGGLRYLEHYEFALVRESLMERERLWAIAPHIVRPMRFVLPHHKGLRPAWLLRLGLFLYDHIGGRKRLPATRVLDLRTDKAGEPLKPIFAKAFEYSDCWVDDARLVVLNAMDAAAHGARIETRTKLVGAVREGKGENSIWRATLERASGDRYEVSARMIVNAAGPWVEQVLKGPMAQEAKHGVRLVQGSHIVVPKLFEHERAYFFQNSDGRIIFAIPYESEFTLIGTTDRDFSGDPAKVDTPDDGIAYLCAAASEYFAEAVTPSQVVWTYSGVRPLYDDGASKAQEATRDFVLKLSDEAEGAPQLTIYGGKITTFRRLAEDALRLIQPRLGKPSGKAGGNAGEKSRALRHGTWTADHALPGGDFTDKTEVIDKLTPDYPFLTQEWAMRLVTAYGTNARTLLGQAKSVEDLGEHFGATLTAAEVNYLRTHEWAQTVEDIVWRRSKLGLRMTPQNLDQLRAYLES